ALLVSSVVAQDAPKTVNLGVLNNKANILPKPVYPEAAKAAGISGVIAVDVVIDETGKVMSAVADVNDPRERRDADGTTLPPLPADPSLRAASEEAALKAKFAPVLLSGTAVQIKGRILYNFVADRVDFPSVMSDLPARVVDSSKASADSYSPGDPTINGRALTLPSPTYPAAARAVRAEGIVSVRVMVDEKGNVVSASAVSGHPLLRSAAEEAARQATFSQTELNGTPVRVSGILSYKFVLPKVE
ncbi:MAG: energy transducer TonB, partial [Pyrinomonadaceae bacterium]